MGFLRLALVLSLVFPGCAAMEQNFRDNYCNYDGAYKKGYNDSRMGGTMTEGNFQLCYPEQRAESEKGYREGFRAGVGDRGQVQVIPVLGGPPDLAPPPGAGEPLACQYDRDCPPQSVCADRGDGFRFCAAPQGPRFTPCRSQLECGGGSHCRDRGDGLYLCL
jgi:hypothetical protein